MKHMVIGFCVLAMILLAAGTAGAQAPAPSAAPPAEPNAAPPPPPPPGPNAGPPRGPAMGPPVEEIFKAADKDNDGKLALDEFQEAVAKLRHMGPRGPRPEMGDRLLKADSNGDQKVTPEEFKAAFPDAPEGRFAEMDTNKDGVVTKEDRVMRPGGRPGHEGPEGRMPPGESPLMRMVKEADKDGDGKASLDEMKAIRPNFTEEKFKKMDRNSDGFISEADKPAPKPPAQKPVPAPAPAPAK